MVTTAFQSLSEPDQFAAAIRPAQAQITTTQRNHYRARLSIADLSVLNRNK